ncbi:MAG: hypothetical protein E6J43_09060 [Chloroflexi bacterium]|nr:MAG: hypothetical protein E6J43_09060 [Chloroflexota bacterium]
MISLKERFWKARLLAILAAPLFAFAFAPAVFADEPPPFEDPRAILEQLALDPNNNIADVFNETDNSFETVGNVDLDVIEGPDVVPANIAWAQSTCTDCNSMAVALQLALYESGATNVSPENGAIALNIACTRCFTYARAYQLVLPVNNSRDVAENAENEVEKLQKRLEKVLEKTREGKTAIDSSLAEIDTIVSDFRALGIAVQNGEFSTNHHGSEPGAQVERQAMDVATQ